MKDTLHEFIEYDFYSCTGCKMLYIYIFGYVFVGAMVLKDMKWLQ